MTSLTSAAGARQTFGLAHAEELRAGFTPRQVVAKSEQAPQSNLTPSGLLIEHFNLDSLHARRFFCPIRKYKSVPNHGRCLDRLLAIRNKRSSPGFIPPKIIGDPCAAAPKQDARTSNGIGRCAAPLWLLAISPNKMARAVAALVRYFRYGLPEAPDARRAHPRQ
jgi:hypothetical protein